jgi:sirohydrochlorin ferrochelatase
MPQRNAIIVAHGSPSDPTRQDLAMAELSARVAARLPDWAVKGATLASSGSFERALDGLAQPIVYPFFMAAGYFTGEVLPKRIAGWSADTLILPPFGADPTLPSLISRTVLEAARETGPALGEITLLLAAHGSQVSPASRQATLALSRQLEVSLPLKAVVAGFLEEAPFLADVANGIGPAICLPLFTLSAGHVESDVPEALATAGFDGMLLPHIGSHAGVPRLIAEALSRHALKCAA